MCALTSAVGGPIALAGAATVTSAAGVARPGAIASPEPSPIAIDPCTVLGIVAHAVAVFIHKRTVTLGSPVTGDLRGLCRTTTQRIACAFQPCGTRVSPRAIYPGVIRETPPRIQAAGRRGRRGASPSARSLTGTRSAGRGYRNCRSKGHRSYHGYCRHAHTVILMRSFHLAPLSACQGRHLVLCGGFCPLHYQYEPGRYFLAPVFEQPRKNEGNPRPWRSLRAREQARSRNKPALARPRAPAPSQETEVLTVFLFLKLRRENLPSATLALQPQELPDVGFGHMGGVLVEKVARGHDAP